MTIRIPWLDRQLEKLLISRDEIESLKNIGNNIYDEIRAWSPLKLIFLKYYAVGIYTPIIKRRYRNMYYVDLFSGSGINKIERKQDFCLGSPLLISKLIPESIRFNKMFFCDKESAKTEALNLRMKSTGISENSYEIYSGDCNDCIDDIISSFQSPNHSLIFIDPYSMEISWTTMNKILKLQSDIIFCFQTVQIPRAHEGENLESFFKDIEKVDEIYATTPRGSVREAILQLYINDMLSERAEDSIYEKIRIKKDRRFFYDIIFMTRKTSGDNPWMKAIRDAKNQIEKNTSEAVKRSLNVLTGRQRTLRSY